MLPKQTSHELEFMTMVSSGNVFEAREFIRSLPEDKTVFDINSPNFDVIYNLEYFRINAEFFLWFRVTVPFTLQSNDRTKKWSSCFFL